MAEVDQQLWLMGVPAKTKHNEVAPAQYEIALVYESTNVATDHNQVVMDTLRRVALHHDLVCLLHEKPFAGINGSGKHNNWSLGSNDGQNLLEPGKTPHDNLQFLVFLMAVIAAVDTYAPILRASAATPGNDHRLGANEAPPAIISVFLGEQLDAILEGIEKGQFKAAKAKDGLNINVNTLPNIPLDSTDRNRTSPFAFTGNKFEFRMVGSSASVSMPNIVLNTIVAEKLDEIATELEKTSADKLEKVVQDILVRLIKKYKRIIFNGNNYAQDWVKEAEKRGLPNINSSVMALKAYTDKETLNVFDKYRVLSHKEMESRYEISLERYSKEINIEAQTMLHMSKREITPAVSRYLSEQLSLIQGLEVSELTNEPLANLVGELNKKLSILIERTDGLDQLIKIAQGTSGADKQAESYRDKVVPAMGALRHIADDLENLVAKDVWPIPSYAEMLFLS
jgi:glutamine synthetase